VQTRGFLRMHQAFPALSKALPSRTTSTAEPGNGIIGPQNGAQWTAVLVVTGMKEQSPNVALIGGAGRRSAIAAIQPVQKSRRFVGLNAHRNHFPSIQ
jgi:hypothetical protein